MSSPSQEPVAAEDGWPIDQACPLLLAAVGGEPPDAAPVRKHVVSDSGFAAADRIGAAARETNLDDEGELKERCLRNRFEMGQIMAFGFWQRPCRTRPVLWLRNECRKRSQLRQLAVCCRRWESKMEIPVICTRNGSIGGK